MSSGGAPAADPQELRAAVGAPFGVPGGQCLPTLLTHRSLKAWR